VLAKAIITVDIVYLSVIMSTCMSEVSIDMCTVQDGMRYCYCTSNLCNTKTGRS